MKKIAAWWLLAGCSIAATAANADLITATATLDGAQEVPPNASAATGVATVVFDTTANTLDIAASVTGLFLANITLPSGTGLEFGVAGPFHIHNAPAGTNGAIVVPFPLASFFTETATGIEISAMDIPFAPEQIAQLLAGELYLNLHTVDFPGGEIRGQLSVPEPGTLGALALGLLALGLTRRFAK